MSIPFFALLTTQRALTGSITASGWTDFLILLAVILIVSILIILMARQTPVALNRFGLDQAGHGHGEEHEAHTEPHSDETVISEE